MYVTTLLVLFIIKLNLSRTANFDQIFQNRGRGAGLKGEQKFLYLHPAFYSYTEGASWKILDLLRETHLTLSHSFPVIRLSRAKKVAQAHAFSALLLGGGSGN